MGLHRVQQAARNNALWCDAVCQVHGTLGVWTDALWFNRGMAPRFYPNAITLRPNQGNALGAVLDQLPIHCAVKDSFNDLSLGNAGFQVLFEASWLWRAAAAVIPPVAALDMRWMRVSDEEQLTRWELAWGGISAVPGYTLSERIFLPALLADPNIAFLAAWQGEQLRAGVIANQGAGVVGLSNLFAHDGDAAVTWAGAVAAIAAQFPGRDTVGYERGDDLALAQLSGFESIGPLRVWAR